MLRFSRTLPAALACALLLGGLSLTGCDAVVTTADVPAASAECALGMSDEDAFAELDALETEVDALEAAGSLNGGQANALRTKLRNIRQKIDRGQYCPALAQLGGFRDQVEDFVDDGVLEEAEAEPLLDGADVITGGPPSMPVFVATEVSTGSGQSCGVTAEGEAYCWGRNAFGQLGDGTRENRSVPTLVSGNIVFESISPASRFTCGLATSGQAYCWGNNLSGELGVPASVEESLVPVPVSGGLSFVSLDSGGDGQTCGLTASGQAYCWGRNFYGTLGDGTRENKFTPVTVSGDLSFTSITVGNFHTCGIVESGQAYCWGLNYDGRLGIGTDDLGTDVPTPVAGGLSFTSLQAGGNHTCGVTDNGTGHCWGSNAFGQLGDGTLEDRLVPTPVSTDQSFGSLSTASSHSCGLTETGEAYCWGSNNPGRLGDGTTVNQPTPVPVSGGLSFVLLARGNGAHTCGIDTNGLTHCWGANESGQLGDGTTEARLVPTPVSAP